jgi:hypothetical protein
MCSMKCGQASDLILKWLQLILYKDPLSGTHWSTFEDVQTE